MKRSVLLKVIYETEEASKEGVMNVILECSGAIREVIEIKPKLLK